MTFLPGTALEPDRVVPGVPLVDAATGSPTSMWAGRQKRAVVLAFLHDGCDACATFASTLAAAAPELDGAGADARVVLARPGALAVPVLVDPDGEARRRFLGEPAELPVVLILDRYAAAVESHPATGHGFPSVREIVATLWHQALQCPECGVSTW